jgi:hypothetical protein
VNPYSRHGRRPTIGATLRDIALLYAHLAADVLGRLFR